jgi:hypothetical protein
MVMVGIEARQCVDPVFVLLSLGRVVESSSCVGLVLWGCVATQVVHQPWIVWLCVNTRSIPLLMN